jgi:hypothetical protein
LFRWWGSLMRWCDSCSSLPIIDAVLSSLSDRS